MKITIRQEDIEKYGANSLVGEIMSKNNGIMPKKICLVFPQTSTRWKKENNGPNQWIVLEHNIPCLLKDILYLQSLGARTEVYMPEE